MFPLENENGNAEIKEDQNNHQAMLSKFLGGEKEAGGLKPKVDTNRLSVDIVGWILEDDRMSKNT